jgi:hypothetical protein
MPEISDEQYRKYLTAEGLLDKLLSPKTKRKTEALIKEHFPETVVSKDNDPPELAENQAKLDALSKKFDDHLTALQVRADDDATKAAFSRLNDAGYTDEGIDWIKKTMMQRKIADPEAAAALYDKHHPVQPMTPAGYQPQSWGFGTNPTKDVDRDLLLRDEETWADQEVGRVFAELRQPGKR